MATVAAFTPGSGDLSEQFDQRDRRADLGKKSRLEPCGLHHRLRQPRRGALSALRSGGSAP